MPPIPKPPLASRSPRGWPALTIACLLCLPGCARYDGAGDPLNLPEEAREQVRQEAANDFSCPQVSTAPAVRRVREHDWEDGLFSEYLVHAGGCGRQGNYRVSCREGGLCAVAE